MCFKGLEQVEQFGMAADVATNAVFEALCGVYDAVPEIHEVYIVKFGGIDLLVDGAEELRGYFACVDLVIEMILDDRVVNAIFFWTEPAS